MAKGTLKVFNAFEEFRVDGVYDIDNDQWAMALLTNSVANLLPTETNPALGSTNATECTPGGNYPAGGINLTILNTFTGGLKTFKLDTGVHSAGLITILADPANPTNAKTALIYSKPATSPVDAAAAYIDLTEDGGTTPIDLTGVDLEITFGTGGNPGEILKIPVSNPA